MTKEMEKKCRNRNRWFCFIYYIFKQSTRQSHFAHLVMEAGSSCHDLIASFIFKYVVFLIKHNVPLNSCLMIFIMEVINSFHFEHQSNLNVNFMYELIFAPVAVRSVNVGINLPKHG